LRRRGLVVNHRGVLRILNEDNRLGVRRQAFVVITDCDHRLPIHLNLTSRMELTGINQLWVADITYIRLKQEFVYPAVELDEFYRKVVG
jgi:putative transposase